MAESAQHCVLLTRPAAQQETLARAIADAGWRSVSLPLLAIKPLPFPAGTAQNHETNAQTARVIMELDRFDLLIFISTNAARYGLDWVDNYWPQFPMGIDVLAIGASTAACLRERITTPVIEPGGSSTSEEILELSILKQVQQKRIAIFRGVGGRELLANTLRERGAEVQYIEVYERENILLPAEQLEELCNAQSVDAISVLSGQTLENLAASLHGKSALAGAGKPSSELARLPLLVPSQRIAEQASELGFSTVINCNGANAEAIIAGMGRIADK